MKISLFVYISTDKRLETYDPLGVYSLSFSKQIIPKGQTSFFVGVVLAGQGEANFAISRKNKDGFKTPMVIVGKILNFIYFYMAIE